MKRSKTQIEMIDPSGYLVVENVFSSAEVERQQRACAERVQRASAPH